MKRFLFCLGLTSCVGVAAAEESWYTGPEGDAPAWREVETALPTPPKAQYLHEITMTGGPGHRYFIDTRSIETGEDGVVRYTLVIRTAAGAENVQYEGLRCSTGERKLYALGRADGSWSRSSSARWLPIDARTAGSHHKELFFHYFCTVDGPADMKTIRRAIERGGLRRGDF